MKIKYYDDILIVECDKHKYSHHFKTLKGKWIDVNGKNHFAVTKEYENLLNKIVDDINTEECNNEVQKYNNNLTLKVKEEYYKSFNSKPINFGELKGSEKRSRHSLSSSSYGGSSSSDGFPSPETPGKEKEDDEDEDDDFQYIFEKLEELEKRLEKVEQQRNRK